MILKELLTSQTFKIVPRELAADSMTFTHEETGVITTYAITPTIDRYYLVISKIIALKENHFYKLTVYNGADVVYKGKVYCTNQTIESYSINNGEYVQSSSNNDYIIYE